MWEDLALDLARELRAVEQAVEAKLKKEQLGELFMGMDGELYVKPKLEAPKHD